MYLGLGSLDGSEIYTAVRQFEDLMSSTAFHLDVFVSTRAIAIRIPYDSGGTLRTRGMVVQANGNSLCSFLTIKKKQCLRRREGWRQLLCTLYSAVV